MNEEEKKPMVTEYRGLALDERDATYLSWLDGEIAFQNRTYENCTHTGGRKRIFATIMALRTCRKHFMQTRETAVYGHDE